MMHNFPNDCTPRGD